MPWPLSSHFTTLAKRKKRKRKRNESTERLNFLKKIKTVTFPSQILFKFYRRALEKQTGNISYWHRLCTATGQEDTTDEHQWDPSTKHQGYWWGMVSAQSPKSITRQRPPQPQPVHPAAVQQKKQKPLKYHQTMEQLLFSGWKETLDFNMNSLLLR